MSDLQEDTIFYTQKRSVNILIIDDSEVDLDVYARFLRRDPNWNFQVNTTMDQEEFFEILSQESIDLVLMDYSMGLTDGLSLIQEMKSRLQGRFHQICIIMMTGQGSEKIAVESIKNGASDYISKQLITADFLQKTIKDNLYKFHLATELNKAKAQIERDLIFKIGLNIRQSLDLQTIIETAVEQVKKYLQCDRVLIYRVTPTTKILGESINPDIPRALEFMENQEGVALREDQLRDLQVWSHIERENLSPEYRRLLDNLKVQSRIAIPLFIASLPDTLWGIMAADFCNNSGSSGFNMLDKSRRL